MSVAFAACAAAEPLADEQPFAQLDLPVLTPRQLADLELPSGFRPGDGLRLPDDREPQQQRRLGWVEPWAIRTTPSPNPVYHVDARGRDGAIGLLQIVLADAHQQPLSSWAAAAGVQVREQIGTMRLPPARNRMVMSSDHMHSESLRQWGRVFATDRDQLFLVARDNDGLDSILWVGDDTLLAAVDARSFRGVLVDLERALAGTDVGAMQAAREALQKSGIDQVGGALQAQADELCAQVDAKVIEHDTPIVAEIGKLAAAATDTMATQDFPAAIGTVAHYMAAMQPVAQRLRGDWPPALTQPFGALRQKAATAPGSGPRTAVRALADFVAAEGSSWRDDLPQLLAAAQAFDVAANYADARRWLDVLTKELAPVAADHQGSWQDGVAAACEREAAALAAAGNPEAQRYLRDLAGRVRGMAWPLQWHTLEAPVSVATFCGRLAEYCRLGDDTARLAWLLQEIGPERLFRRSGLRQQDEFTYRSHVHLTDVLRGFVDGELAQATTARERGLAATAAWHELRALALFGRSSHWWDAPLGVAAASPEVATQAGTPARVLQDLGPLLRVVLPPIVASTDESDRLVQLFREGECLDWPLVRQLTFQFEPGDLQRPAWRGELPPRFAWLESRGDDQMVLSAHEQPQQIAGTGFLARMSGLSAETIAESRALKQESATIAAEQAAIDQERPQVLARSAQAKEQGAIVDRDRASLDRGNAAAVKSFNERVQGFNQLLDDAKAKEKSFNELVRSLNARVAAYNPRVSVNNERIMRERAAGGHRVDTMLRRALAQWLDEALGAYEAQLQTRGGDAAAIARELELAKWWFGRTRPAMPAWLDFEPKALADMHRLALERTVHVQPSNEALAQAVVAHWYWSRRCLKLREQEAFFREWARTFRWQRDVKFLKDAIAADGRLGNVDRATMERLMLEADKR